MSTNPRKNTQNTNDKRTSTVINDITDPFTNRIVSYHFSKTNKLSKKDKFMITLYYIIRWLVLIISFVIALLIVNYGIGQLYVLKLEHVICPDRTLDEIRKYNFKNDNKEGVKGDSCYRVNSRDLNWNIIRDDVAFEAFRTNREDEKYLSAIFGSIAFLVIE